MRTNRHLARSLLAASAVAVLAVTAAVGLTPAVSQADEARVQLAHKKPHDSETLKVFQDIFMDAVRDGDKLFHGDAAAEKKYGTTLSRTGMACAMCHPMSADIHPYEYPKFQEQIGKFATLRDMINWCIEKPNEGERIDSDSGAMKALEAYMYWSTRGTPLDPGRH